MDSSTGTSKYRAVRDHLVERIGTMRVGDRLPSEKELCEELGVSRITLRHAVDGLVQDGRLAREHGRGTFVSAPKPGIHYPERFADIVTGFHRQQTSAGHTVATRVLRQELVAADNEIARLLDVPSGARVVELVRLRFVNGQLHQHVVTYLPHDRFPECASADFTTGSLFDYLHERYGVVLSRNDMRVGVEEATADVALNLEVAPSLRLLAVASTVYDQDGHPVAHGVARHTPLNSEIELSLRVAGPTPQEA
ncbi:GntR family transcriptional regulator [Microbacterium sorbitolivorans]|uniref:GntR family transcriptional regulator n=1 Tax=Microbacterium sorbitolivorans TaxID=1867410 RepID=A0A367Y3B6_9MICO|nr:GntR family transcriptional regulator [Microbacterium sorbitolivorans]RCK60099.1 GntR family transcriptional regulator [Microbacterium sorbitolivorans]GGF42758.1 GntR family transcriptional regulator [Microbacterium sorbitolivorans]